MDISKSYKVFQCYLFVVTLLIRGELRKLHVIISLWCLVWNRCFHTRAERDVLLHTLLFPHGAQTSAAVERIYKKKEKVNISHSSRSVKTQQLWTIYPKINSSQEGLGGRDPNHRRGLDLIKSQRGLSNVTFLNVWNESTSPRPIIAPWNLWNVTYRLKGKWVSNTLTQFSMGMTQMWSGYFNTLTVLNCKPTSHKILWKWAKKPHNIDIHCSDLGCLLLFGCERR